MKPGVKNLSASVLARLRNQAKKSNQTFNEVLTYYGLERFLYRITKSEYEGKFVLKGALVMVTWGASPMRITKDMDLRAFIQPDLQSVIGVMRDICNTEVEADAIQFDPDSIRAEQIVETAIYPGIRVRLMGFIERVRIPLQIDMAFSGPIVPEPKIRTYPTILDLPPPQIRSYPTEAIVAEKLDAIIQLGAINTRMKDFYDLWKIQSGFEFKGSLLLSSIRSIFDSRQTRLPEKTPIGISMSFAKDNQSLWEAFLRRIGESNPEIISFEHVIEDVWNFVEPLIQSLREDRPFNVAWSPETGWR